MYLLLSHSLAYAAGATEHHRWTSEVREVAGRAPVTGTAWTALALAPARSTAARHKNNEKHSCSCDAAVVMLLSLEEHCHTMGPLDGLDMWTGGVGRRWRRSEGWTHRTVPAQAATLLQKSNYCFNVFILGGCHSQQIAPLVDQIGKHILKIRMFVPSVKSCKGLSTHIPYT